MAFGKTRPLEPIKVSCPNSALKSRKRRGGNDGCEDLHGPSWGRLVGVRGLRGFGALNALAALWTTWLLAILAYVNFFTHHYTIDIRLGLFAFSALIFWRVTIVFTPDRTPRRMPMLLGLVLVALFIWFAVFPRHLRVHIIFAITAPWKHPLSIQKVAPSDVARQGLPMSRFNRFEGVACSRRNGIPYLTLLAAGASAHGAIVRRWRLRGCRSEMRNRGVEKCRARLSREGDAQVQEQRRANPEDKSCDTRDRHGDSQLVTATGKTLTRHIGAVNVATARRKSNPSHTVVLQLRDVHSGKQFPVERLGRHGMQRNRFDPV